MPLQTNWGFPQGNNIDKLRLGERAQRKTEVDWSEAQAIFQNSGSIGHVGWSDNFLGDLVRAEYVNDLSGGSAVTLAADVAGGVAVITTDTDDNDHATISLGLHWLVSSGFTVLDVRYTNVTAITLRAVEIGVSDATSETNGIAFSSHDATPVAVADDAAVFAINSDESVVTWSMLTVNGGGTAVRTDSATAPVAGTYQNFRIVIDSAGNAQFYINGAAEGTQALAVATTALLTPWVTLKSLSGAIKTVNLAYLGMFGTLA